MGGGQWEPALERPGPVSGVGQRERRGPGGGRAAQATGLGGRVAQAHRCGASRGPGVGRQGPYDSQARTGPSGHGNCPG